MGHRSRDNQASFAAGFIPSPVASAHLSAPPIPSTGIVSGRILNSTGWFGALETDPGPSGVDKGAEDELMIYPFKKALRRLDG
jgi:hypothetical protein